MEPKPGIRTLPILLAAWGMGLALSAHAAFPLGNMGPRDLGLQYGLAFRGQDITKAGIPSRETIHALSLGYAPIPYLALEAGVGLDKFTIDADRAAPFRGEYAFTPVLGFTLASPCLAEMVRAVAGARFLYLGSEDGRGYSYSGLVTAPFLGALLSPSGYFDAEAGARLHLLDGTMEGPAGPGRPFANREILRGYAALTVKSPAERVFLTIDADISPGLDSDWSHGPREAAVGISFGALLGSRRNPDPERAARDTSTYFSGFPEMRKKLEKMAEEIE